MSRNLTRKQIASTVTAATCVVMLAAASPPAWAKAEPQALVQMEKYCIASWRNARIDMQEWSDCTQATLADLLSRIPRERLCVAIENPQSWERRELTRCIWCTVQRVRRARHNVSLEEGLTSDDAPHVSREMESYELREAICSEAAGLSERQQEVMLQLLDGAAVKEIAVDLDVPAARISDDKYKAIKKLRKHFADGELAAV